MTTKTNAEKAAVQQFQPSAVLAQALGPHGKEGENPLVQASDEDEISFAVRCIEALGADLMAQRKEVAALNRQLAAQKGQTTKARNAIVELEEAMKPRTIGKMRNPKAAKLLQMIDDAQEVVLAFSDGTAELVGVKPRQVDARDFGPFGGAVQFTRTDLSVIGPGGEAPKAWLAGVALLLDGEQKAWAALPKPFDLGRDQTHNLTGSVIFR